VQRLGGVALVLLAPLEIQIVRTHVVGLVLAHLLRLGRCERHLQRARDGRGDLRLHREHVLERTIEALAPELEAVGAHQAYGDAYAGSGAAHAAFEHGADAEVRGDARRIDLGAAEARHRVARGDSQAAHFRQVGQQILGDALAKVVAVGLGREVLEVEHGE
jgi:hypothetical protein